MHRIQLVVVAVIAVLALAGCDRKAEASNVPGSSTTSAARTATAVAPPASTPAADPGGAAAVSTPTSAVAHIVFLDKEHPCHCTQAAMDASWAALQETLAGRNIPVERIHVDTQADRAAPYLALQAMLAVPGIYFLDAAGGLVNMLQGEVTAEAIRAILFPS